MPGTSSNRDNVRAAELIAALSLATDLGMGLPFEHGLHSTLVAMRLADKRAVDARTASQVYYGCLLFYVGCTADAEIQAELFDEGMLVEHFTPVMLGAPLETVGGVMRALAGSGGAAPVRALRAAQRLPRAVLGHRLHIRALCEVAQMLAKRLGLPAEIHGLFSGLTERWDGKGEPGRASGIGIPLPVRIIHVARDATFQRLLGGTEYATRVISERSGRAFDPAIATLLVDHADEILALDDETSAWKETLAAEPVGRLMLHGAAVDEAIAAMGDFADLISPFLVGHSTGVAELAAAAARRRGHPDDDVLAVRRAGFLHDIGRVAIPVGIWQKPGGLAPAEWERVRLHAYHTERVLSRSSFLSALAPVAICHHERLDGSGYHRGVTAPALPPLARILAAADVYHAMTEPRPHRDALSPQQAAAELGEQATAGMLDADAVAAVLDAAGQRAPRIARPAGLTDREAQVVALLARGMQTKQIARRLGISVKTADRHVQNSYAKIGVSTRAAATLFAMRHGLTTWGEFPIVGPAERS